MQAIQIKLSSMGKTAWVFFVRKWYGHFLNSSAMQRADLARQCILRMVSALMRSYCEEKRQAAIGPNLRTFSQLARNIKTQIEYCVLRKGNIRHGWRTTGF